MPSLARQGGGDIGARMARAMRPHRTRVVLVGCDIPDLRASDVAAAFRALRGRADAVFGPAEDGGFYLVGFGPRRVEHPFSGVRWSGPRTLTDTLPNFRGRRVAVGRRLRDVDTAEDLRLMRAGGAPGIDPPRRPNGGAPGDLPDGRSAGWSRAIDLPGTPNRPSVG
jgi:glycosyltransferase A (GT-A) superfamily protein (DUF2064 family)